MRFRALALAAPLLMITGCTNTLDATPPKTPPAPPALDAPTDPRGTTEGTFRPWRTAAQAVTYDQAVVPAGATATVTITRTGYGTTVRLTTAGLLPSRPYGAHLHTAPCTGVPDEAGPHYQNHPDPVSPTSGNPVYANPGNEIWLDFTTDPKGAATATAAHGWNFDSSRPPRSLILHAEHTHTTPGEAGKAGPRAACLTLPA